jgi:hypothetical protein
VVPYRSVDEIRPLMRIGAGLVRELKSDKRQVGLLLQRHCRIVKTTAEQLG